MIERLKVLAYVTRSSRLLVFTQPESPEAGIQVPGGTVEPDEAVEDAALREAIEESGLAELRLGIFLGDLYYTDHNLNEIRHVHFFHVWCEEEPPTTWRHYEFTASDRPANHQPIPLDFFWLDLTSERPPLIGYQGYCIPKLMDYLGL